MGEDLLGTAKTYVDTLIPIDRANQSVNESRSSGGNCELRDTQVAHAKTLRLKHLLEIIRI